MARVIIIAEGPTEEKFCRTMFPYFYDKQLYDISVSILPSKVTASEKDIKVEILKVSKNSKILETIP